MLPANTRDALPVFPLPNLVLMPGDALPLHIFEPRYQELLATVMEGDRLMGIGTLQEDGQTVHEVLGVGRVMRCEPGEEGRSNIVLVHVATVRIEEECEQTEAFRRFRTVEVEEAKPSAQQISACQALLYQLAATTEGLSDDALRITALSGMTLVNAVARRLYQRPRAKLRYLASTDAERAEAVCSELAALMASRPSIADA